MKDRGIWVAVVGFIIGFLLVVLLAVFGNSAAHAVTLSWVANKGDTVKYNVYRKGDRVATVPHDESKIVEQADCHTGKVARTVTWQSKDFPFICSDEWRVTAVNSCDIESGFSEVAEPCPPLIPGGLVSGP